MSDDEFSKQTGGIVEQLAIGAAGVAAAALTESNVAGAMASAATFGALEYFKAKATASNTAIGAAEYAALFEEFRKLDDRVAKLEQKDRQDVLTKQAVFSRFARDVSEASTHEKREALVNATAYQFDPRKGTAAVRDYWLRVVRETRDAELALVMLLVEHEAVAFHQSRVFKVKYDVEEAQNLGASREVLPLSTDEAIAFESIALQMGSKGAGRLITSIGGRNVAGPSGPAAGPQSFALSPDGRVLASYCKDS